MFCSKLCEITRDAVKRVVKRFEHTGIEFPELGFRCGLCDDDHYCVLSDDHTRVICSETRRSVPVTPEMSCWIKSTDSNKPEQEESVSVLRDNRVALCRTLNTSEPTLLSLNCELYSHRIIDQPTMLEVNREKGFKGANILMDFVEMKVEQNHEYLPKVLQIMEKQECLYDVVMTMKKENISTVTSSFCETWNYKDDQTSKQRSLNNDHKSHQTSADHKSHQTSKQRSPNNDHKSCQTSEQISPNNNHKSHDSGYIKLSKSRMLILTVIIMILAFIIGFIANYCITNN